MPGRKWAIQLSVILVCLGLGLLTVAQLRTQNNIRQTAVNGDWEYIVAGLIDGNARLRAEIQAVQGQLDGLQAVEGGVVLVESLVDEVNHLRITNGLVEVSGQGIRVEIRGPISVLDLHDLINELWNAGAEGLALNGERIVAWTAISTDGEHVTVDGQSVDPPYHLEAIGNAQTLDAALSRPGGLISLLNRARDGSPITISRQGKLTLPVVDQPLVFVLAEPVE